MQVLSDAYLSINILVIVSLFTINIEKEVIHACLGLVLFMWTPLKSILIWIRTALKQLEKNSKIDGKDVSDASCADKDYDEKLNESSVPRSDEAGYRDTEGTKDGVSDDATTDTQEDLKYDTTDTSNKKDAAHTQQTNGKIVDYLMIVILGSIGLSTKVPCTIMLCPSSLASPLVSVHTSPCHRVRHRDFIFSIHMYTCPPYMHIKYFVILICSF